MDGLLSLDRKRRVDYRIWLWCYSGRNMAGVSPGVMAPDCENVVWLAVMTPERCTARVTASRGGLELRMNYRNLLR